MRKSLIGVGIGSNRRRSTMSSAWDDVWDEPSITATEVIDAEGDRWTGLVDQHGEPIFRPKVKMGFGH